MQEPHQQWGDVGLEVQGCNASISNTEGCQGGQEHAQKGLDDRHEPEQAHLESSLWLDDLPCKHRILCETWAVCMPQSCQATHADTCQLMNTVLLSR